VLLLEALIALAIVSIAGFSAVTFVAAIQRDQTFLAVREQTLVAADRVLTAMVLLTEQDLDLRLGRHGVNAFAVQVERPEPGLYRIAVEDTLAGRPELLVTVVYRPGALR
jgi:type II secretory pathway component PulJ